MTLVRLAALSLLSCVIVCGPSLWAQTPDGQVPANEGVCDELKGATPGLYGLCVAFCEAQDCEESDPVAAAQQCRPSSLKILSIYNRKKEDGDPDMPCVSDPCPCFTTDDIVAVLNTDPNGLFNTCYEGNENNGFMMLATWNPPGSGALGGWIWANDFFCAYVAQLPGNPLIDRYQEVTETQADECRALIQPFLESCEWIADAVD